MNDPAIKTRNLLISRLGQLSRLMAQRLEQQLAPIGLTYQEMRIAGLLMGDDRSTQNDLARKLSVRPATLSVAISKLEQQGIVKRIPSKTDRRANYLQLIASKKIATVDSLLLKIEADITLGIGKKDLAVVSKVLTTIIRNMQSPEGKEIAE
jgi:DNA-binding MarR family transcriptional regulator